jgi:hypothetical protein
MDNAPSKYAKPQDSSGLSREMDIVFAIFLILIVGFLFFPNLTPGRRSLVALARQEMASITAAINQYHAIYNRWPVSNENLRAAAKNDFTFGTHAIQTAGPSITNSFVSQANNSEVMAIIMDLEKFPGGGLTVNSNHILNPGKYLLFSTKIVVETNSHGLGLDGVLRDPWGHPYIISIDLNNDGNCRDVFYGKASVSESSPSNQAGLNKLSRPTPPPYKRETLDTFQLKGPVMIWSMGPDGKADPSLKADEGVNKDNILSWN